MLLLLIYASFSWCRGLACGVWLWHFLSYSPAFKRFLNAVAQLIEQRTHDWGSGVVSLCKITSIQDFEQVWLREIVRPRDYKTVSMLNSTEHKISTVHKTKMLKNCFCCQTLKMYLSCYLMLKVKLFIGILTFIIMINRPCITEN